MLDEAINYLKGLFPDLSTEDLAKLVPAVFGGTPPTSTLVKAAKTAASVPFTGLPTPISAGVTAGQTVYDLARGTPSPAAPPPETPPTSPTSEPSAASDDGRPKIDLPKERPFLGSAATRAEYKLPTGLGSDFPRRQALEDKLAKEKNSIGSWISNLAGGFADALATAANAGYKTNLRTDALEEVFKIQKAGEKESRDRLEQSILNDPDSGLSKQFQASLAHLISKDPNDPLIKRMSASEISKTLPGVEKSAQMDLQRELKDMQMAYLRANKEEQKDVKDQARTDRINQAVLNYTERFENNPVIKELNKQGLSFNQLKSLMNEVRRPDGSINTVAFASAGTKAARAMGEVGVLTETDIKRYVQSGKLVRSIGDKLTKIIKGVPTEATQGEILQMVDVMEDAFKEGFASKQEEYVNRLSRNFPDLSPGEAAYRLGFTDSPAQWAPQTNAPKITTQAQYAALPKGARYKDASGKTRIKK